MNEQQLQESIEAQSAVDREIAEAIEYNSVHHLGKIAVKDTIE
jgi:hypothetical protein